MRPTKSTLLGTVDGPSCSSERSRAAPIASELVDPSDELVSVEPQILSELHVGNAVRPGPLVEPAHRNSQEIRGFLNCQPGHRGSQSPLSLGHSALRCSLMGSQKAIALPSAKHVRMGSTLLPESTSPAGDFRLVNQSPLLGAIPSAF